MTPDEIAQWHHGGTIVDTTLAAEQNGAIVAAWIASLDTTSERTKDSYERNMRPFLAFLEQRGLSILEADRSDILDYRHELEQRTSAATGRSLKPSTRKAYMTALKSFYSDAEAESRGAFQSPAKRVKSPKLQKSKKKALNPEQALRLLNAQSGGTELERLRNAAMIDLMCTRGLRTVEVSRANVEDLDQDQGIATLYVQGKGRDDREEYVVLSSDTLRAIYRWLDAREEALGKPQDKDPLFCSLSNRNRGKRIAPRTVSNVARAALDKEGLHSAKITAHSLRHTAVTLAIDGDAKVQDVQAMARHKDINTTMGYYDARGRLEAKAESAVDKVLGRRPPERQKTA